MNFELRPNTWVLLCGSQWSDLDPVSLFICLSVSLCRIPSLSLSFCLSLSVCLSDFLFLSSENPQPLLSLRSLSLLSPGFLHPLPPPSLSLPRPGKQSDRTPWPPSGRKGSCPIRLCLLSPLLKMKTSRWRNRRRTDVPSSILPDVSLSAAQSLSSLTCQDVLPLQTGAVC